MLLPRIFIFLSKLCSLSTLWCFLCTTECQAFSLVVRIGSPRPLTRTASECCPLPPPLVPGGGAHSLAGGANVDEGTDTLVL